MHFGTKHFGTMHSQNIITRIERKTGTDAPIAMRQEMLGNIYASPVGGGGRVNVTESRTWMARRGC